MNRLFRTARGNEKERALSGAKSHVPTLAQLGPFARRKTLEEAHGKKRSVSKAEKAEFMVERAALDLGV